MTTVSEGDLIWVPPDSVKEASRIHHYLRFLEAERGLEFVSYARLHRWSVTELEAFWESVVRYFDVRFHAPPACTLSSREMPGARFFPGATLNYAEHALRRGGPDVAVISLGE